MDFLSVLILLSFGFFLGMLALLEYGRRAGRRLRAADPDHWRSGVALADGAVFALFGLLIAFCYSGAAERYQARSVMITTEANALGTAWLRLDLLAPEVRERARTNMRDYVDARLAVYRAFPDHDAVQAAIAAVGDRQARLWNEVIAARGVDYRETELLLLPALNEAFDCATERVQSMSRHPPTIVFVLLMLLGLGCALLAGYSLSDAPGRPTVHMLVFAGVIAVTVYVILDLEYPRHGLIRLDDFDRVLIELRETMR